MHRSTIIFISFLSVLAGLLGYNYFFQPFQNLGSELQSQLQNNGQELSDSLAQETNILTVDFFDEDFEVSEIVEALTPGQKVGQLLLAPLIISNPVSDVSEVDRTTDVSETDQENKAILANLNPGGVTLFGSNVSFDTAQIAIRDIKAELSHTQVSQEDLLKNETSYLFQSILSAPIIAVDHEGGTTQRFSGEGFTVLPSWQTQCQTPLLEMQHMWRDSAYELQAVGVTMVLAPVVDFAQNHPVLGTRICDSNPDIVAEYGASWYTTWYQEGIQPVLKHFPGIGTTTRDLHTQFDTVVVGAQEAQLYTTIFDEIEEIQLAVMVAHVGVENQYPDIPCSLSEACVGELSAIDETVLLVSDAMEMESVLRNENTLSEVSELAIAAGVHVLVFGPDVTLLELVQVKEDLLDLYQESSFFQEKIDQAVTRILTYKRSTMGK